MKTKIKKNKATAISPSNIAFIKFWGKKNPVLNIPFNDSISMNLGDCFTTTTVEFSSRYKKDKVFIDEMEVSDSKKDRVVKILDIVRKEAGLDLKSKVVSKNNFPSDAGIASSASAFSALALAASCAAGLKLSTKELSILARLGSGSACRSLVNGFAEWKRGKDNESSYAIRLADESFWDLVDIVTVVDKGKKKTSSTEGHGAALTSPYFKTRLLELKTRIPKLKEVLLKKNFKEFGRLLEEEAVSLHVAAMTSRPPIFYWNKGTIEVMQKLLEWREEGLYGYFTMDAGSNVHVFSLAKDLLKLDRRLKQLPEVLYTIVNKPARGTRLVQKHLF